MFPLSLYLAHLWRKSLEEATKVTELTPAFHLIPTLSFFLLPVIWICFRLQLISVQTKHALAHTSTRFYSSNKADDRQRRPKVSGLSIKVITACSSSSQHCIRRKKRRRRNKWSVAFEYDPLPRSLNWCRQCACVGESLAEDACSYYSMLARESGLSQVWWAGGYFNMQHPRSRLPVRHWNWVRERLPWVQLPAYFKVNLAPLGKPPHGRATTYVESCT